MSITMQPMRRREKRRAISPLIATLILVAITIVGGVVVYRLFLTSSGSISQNLHATIGDINLTPSTVTLSVKNDGTFAWRLTDVRIGVTSLNIQASTDISPGRSASYVGDVSLLSLVAGRSYTVSATVTAYDGAGVVVGTYVTSASIFALPG